MRSHLYCQSVTLKKDVADIVSDIAALNKSVDALKGRTLRHGQRDALREAAEELRVNLRPTLNPKPLPPAIFDPSDTRVFGRVAALALVAQDLIPLARISHVYGSGVYALYYSGKSSLYTPISGKATPIYVGKSTPPDGALTVVEQGTALTERLQKHARSIKNAIDLGIEDFSYRFLVVGSGWEAPAELELIRYFRPVWNKGNGLEPVQGFGNNDPGSGRESGSKSEWDTLHTGRPSKSLKANEKTADQLTAQIDRHFKEVATFEEKQKVVDHFLDSLAAPPTNI